MAAASAAGLLALLLATLSFAAPASASGTGPTWTTTWEGDNNPPDSSDPSGVDGVWNGVAHYVTGPGGVDGSDLAFQFDGTNYVSGPVSLGALWDDDFTIETRFSTTQADGFIHDLMSTRASCGAGPFWQVFTNGNGDVNAQFYELGAGYALTGVAAVNDGAFHVLNLQRVGPTITMTLDGTVVDTTNVGDAELTKPGQVMSVGGGNPCVNVGTLRPFVGNVDYVTVTQGQEPDGQDLAMSQASTPVVAPGGTGTLVVNRTALTDEWVDSAQAVVFAPTGVTWTSATDPNSTCTVTNPTTITCPATDYGPGANPVTVGFAVAPTATPGTTVNAAGNFTILSNTDPDPSNNMSIQLAIDIAPDAGVPLVNPVVGGGAAVLALIGLGGWQWARRRRAVIA